ncbi:protein arginine N-methyltransferase 5-like protein, partial [Dinothrombium tinctorium]
LDWNKFVVGKVVTDDIDSETFDAKRIEKQIGYAAHLGLPVILFESPVTHVGITQLARVINSKVSASVGMNMAQMWIQIAISSPVEQALSTRNDQIKLEDDKCTNDEGALREEFVSDPWQQWNMFRSLINLDRRVGIALELNGDLPDQEVLSRWGGEPVKCIVIPTSMFMTNRKGYPVLSRSYQQFIHFLVDKMARDVQFIVKGLNKHSDIMHYAQYLEHIRAMQLPTDSVSRFARGYEDYLQIPLQPLMDNLESCTYEIFEKDPVKYKEYQNAIFEAMKTIETENELIVMVVGAGRGPLVRATLAAAESLSRKVHIYAVEKNPYAIVTLKHIRETDWGGNKGTPFGYVEVIDSDMRDWVCPRKADIVVSELLGSFGDNELSPECLDGVWKCVKKETISIPQSYTSYLAPIMSHKVYSEASALKEREKPSYTPFEWSYVVHLKNCYLIDKPKPLFTFEHTELHKPPSEKDNSRYLSLTFKPSLDCICHGFAGYFETTLFGNIKLGTVHGNHTPGMFSWFPIYFPLHNPINIQKNQNIKVHFWRLINKRAVWYEWCLTQPQPTAIHNPNGRSHPIGLL